MAEGPDEIDEPDAPPQAPVTGGRAGGSGREDTSGWYAIAGTGIEFVTAIGVFLLIGWWLDRKWNSFPWLTIAGAAVGFAVGLYLLIKAGRDAFRD